MAERKVPGEEVAALRRELDAADQRPPLGGAERDGARIGGTLLDLLEAGGGCRGGGGD
jgi:hypothetical protein